LVVHGARREDLLDHPRDRVNVEPVRRDFCGGQACEIGDVAASKNDDRMTASDGVPLEVCVTDAPGVKRLPNGFPQTQHPAPRFRASQSSGHVRVIRRRPRGAAIRLGVSGRKARFYSDLSRQTDNLVDAPRCDQDRAQPSIDLGDVCRWWNRARSPTSQLMLTER
jgi:hypothetical protein